MRDVYSVSPHYWRYHRTLLPDVKMRIKSLSIKLNVRRGGNLFFSFDYSKRGEEEEEEENRGNIL